MIPGVMPTVETRACVIQDRTSAVGAASQAQRFALRWGLPARRATELAIVVSELASNIVKHGVSGEIRRRWDPGGPPPGAVPPEAALARARRGPGAGLGAVPRLADRLEYRLKHGENEDGKVLTARFLLR